MSKLHTRNKWSLSLGIIGRDMIYVLVSLFLLTYLQYTGLFQSQQQFLVLTLIIMLCRIWDAINDPMMGTIIANTHTRLGKYRPWVMVGAVLSSCFLLAMFTVRFENGWANVAFVGSMYLLWSMAYTMNDIAYWDLLPALTSEKRERDSLTSLVVTFSSVGAFISGALVPVLTSINQIQMYRLIAFVWTGIFLCCQFLVFFGVHDNSKDRFCLSHDEVKDEEGNFEYVGFKKMIRVMFSNKQLLVAALAIFLYTLASSLLNAFGLNFFYFKFGYPSSVTTNFAQNGALMMTVFTVIYGVGTLISQGIYPALAKKYSRNQLLNFAIAVLAFGYITFFFCANLMTGLPCFLVLIAVGLFIFAGQGIIYMVIIVMLTNTIEYGEWRTGKNYSAITFTARPFMVKLAGSLQYGIVVLTLVISSLYPITQSVGQIEAAMNMVNEGVEHTRVISYLQSMEGERGIAEATTIVSEGFAQNVPTHTINAQLKDFSSTLFFIQPAQMRRLIAAMTLLPIILFFIAVILLKRKYIIDEPMYESILHDIQKRKEDNEKITRGEKPNPLHSDWFKDAIVYQIYPRSFNDSNGDGIGDIPGIIQKLDYLQSLGVNCVWLSPIYESPMDDNGYDISNYKAVHDEFGTLEDFKLMISEMHKRGIRLIMDMVLNHTSDEHAWFRQASQSKDSPYHDYYLWRDTPNNWTGFFAESTWTYNEKTNEYYLHLFGKKQPDLSWDNPKVREEIKDILKFYLDLGVDGFRLDVINLISKDTRFKNGRNPLILVGKKYFINGPHLHEYLQEIHKSVFSKYDCMTVGETVFTDTDDTVLLTDKSRNELSMIFNFEHTNVDNFLGVKWLMRKFSLKRFKKILDKYQYALADIGWNSIFYENHDQRRSPGRFGTCDDAYRVQSAKLLANTMYFLKGTPFMYQGQEIGMTNWEVERLEDFQDIEARNVLNLMRKLPLSKKYINRSIRNGCRDNARTPMQWDDSEYAGFSTAAPWLPVNPNKNHINVKAASEDPNSILNYYKKLIAVYKAHSELRNAVYKDIVPKHKKIFAYERRCEKNILLVVSNFSRKTVKHNILKNYGAYKREVLLNNYENLNDDSLEAYQSVVILLTRA